MDRIQARQRAVRAQFGPGAAHVWFLVKDPMQFARCGTLQIKPRGRDKAVHTTIAPTAEQLAVIAASGRVYWLDGQQVHVPYGVHDFVHTPEKGEAWDFPDWRRDWPNDSRISHPLPAPDATRWGLVPLSLHQLTRPKATFSLREAHEVMQALEDVQRARWRRRRADARELHASRQAPPTPPPAPASTPSPPRAAVPQTLSDTPETVQRERPPPPPPPAGIDAPGVDTQSTAPQTASTRPSAGHDGQPVGLPIPPLPRHPPFSPPPRSPPTSRTERNRESGGGCVRCSGSSCAGSRRSGHCGVRRSWAGTGARWAADACAAAPRRARLPCRRPRRRRLAGAPTGQLQALNWFFIFGGLRLGRVGP